MFSFTKYWLELNEINDEKKNILVITFSTVIDNDERMYRLFESYNLKEVKHSFFSP